MQEVALEGGVIRWRGNLDMERGPNGLVPRRLPAWTKPQVPGFVELMATMPSGVRTEFVTSSRAIELEVLLTGLELLPFNPAESGRLSDVDAAFDLVIDDGDVWTVRAKGNSKFLVNRDRLDESEFVAGAPSTIRFDGLPGGKSSRGHAFGAMMAPQQSGWQASIHCVGRIGAGQWTEVHVRADLVVILDELPHDPPEMPVGRQNALLSDPRARWHGQLCPSRYPLPGISGWRITPRSSSEVIVPLS